MYFLTWLEENRRPLNIWVRKSSTFKTPGKKEHDLNDVIDSSSGKISVCIYPIAFPGITSVKSCRVVTISSHSCRIEIRFLTIYSLPSHSCRIEIHFLSRYVMSSYSYRIKIRLLSNVTFLSHRHMFAK